ncbi:DUF2029 domain-containing protein [Pedobacter sp. HMF7647]|uniref:DUF2029 domain-containing protein n=1 Tax=Hufsiella arboris TaxID=2695275 RepID=A0A7K1YAY2_9SPHI|nr:glycosyltransferase family 87 protein [Hufsiella arboris]MXV51590.1 DUF2029 domain-containing protein [Hufsiella arboris]
MLSRFQPTFSQRNSFLRSIYSALFSLCSWRYLFIPIWTLLAVVVTHYQLKVNLINNFLIFRGTYVHALNGVNLYDFDPSCCQDTNHYGPIFSLIMAPLSFVGVQTASYIFQIANALLVWYAIDKLPLNQLKKNAICLICTQELNMTLQTYQTNGAIAAFIILGWVCIVNRKDFWGVFWMMTGFFIKLYSIVGLVFFFISSKKKMFIYALVPASVILFILPMVIFKPAFITQSYIDWVHSLQHKNEINLLASTTYQDVSVMGMVKRIFKTENLPLLPFLLPAAVIFMLPILRKNSLSSMEAKFSLLASALIFPVLFSTGSETVTYIIAYAGIGIWFVTRQMPYTAWQIILMVIAIYLGSLFETDLCPHYIKKHYMIPYALKALPTLMVWLTIIYELVFPVKRTEQTTSNDTNKIHPLTQPALV